MSSPSDTGSASWLSLPLQGAREDIVPLKPAAAPQALIPLSKTFDPESGVPQKQREQQIPRKPLPPKASPIVLPGAQHWTDTPLIEGAVAVEFDDEKADSSKTYSNLATVLITFQLAGVNFANSGSNGLIVVGLPAITKAINLPPDLAFWPASVTPLATASAILLAGAISDVTSPRSVDLIGCLLTGIFMLAVGAAQTGEQMVILRAIQGLGLAFHFAASVALITTAIPAGRRRNIAFATWGLSQPLGFSFGLVIGGVLVESLGWRHGWFMYGGLTMGLFALGVWILPKEATTMSLHEIGCHLRQKVDWIGAGLASAAMALISYLSAILSTDIFRIEDADSICLLCFGVACSAGFVYWMHYQVKRQRKALIPNAFWRNATFSSMCITVALSFAVVQCLELFASLFFQEIQGLSELQAAIRILPSLIVGVILNLTMGLFVNKIPAVAIVVVSSILAAISPLLMAVIDPDTTYWANAFVAQLFQPVSCDCLVTVGLIVVTEIFPKEQHSLAGAVFNTMSQLGTALGFAVMQIVSTLETRKYEDTLSEEEALLRGYRASFWTMFAFMLSCAVIGGLGLRKTGKVGLAEK